MIFGPSHQLKIKAVTAAPAQRTVMYLNRRKNDSRDSHSVPCAQSKMYWLK